MGILDSVLEYKKYKDAQDSADITAIPSAINAFNVGQQQAKKSQLDLLTNQITAAKSGMRVTQDKSGAYGLQPDPTLQQAGGGNVLLVGNDGQVELAGQYGKKDKVFKKSLSKDEIRERAEVQGDVSVDVAKRKAELPTAEAKNKKFEIDNALQSVDFLESLANKVPAGYAGIVSSGKGFVTRGETETDTKQYEKEVKAAAAQIYRAYTGDTRLSDEDAAARAYPLLWDPSEGEKLKKSSFERLKTGIKKRQEVYDTKYGGGSESNLKSGGSNIPDGTLGKAKDGTPVIRKDGKWVAA